MDQKVGLRLAQTEQVGDDRLQRMDLQVEQDEKQPVGHGPQGLGF